MKNILFTMILLVAFFTASAQDSGKTRKERKAEKEAKQAEQVKNLLNDKAFVFNATHALPMGGGSMYLNYDYDVKVENDTVTSYLPFFGVAYHADYGQRKSPFDFTQPLDDYKMEKEKDGYLVDFELSNGIDHLNYTFHISKLGFATLHVTSTNRQSISYYGTIDEIEKEE